MFAGKLENRGTLVRMGQGQKSGPPFYVSLLAPFAALALVGCLMWFAWSGHDQRWDLAPQQEKASALWSPRPAGSFTSLSVSPEEAAAAAESAAQMKSVLNSGQSEQAIENTLAAQESNPAALFELAGVLFERGDYKRAREVYERLQTINPAHRLTAYRSHYCALLLGRFPAINEVVLPPDSTAGLYARAASAWLSGQASQAETFVKLARSTRSPNLSTYESDLKRIGFHESQSQ